MKKYWFWIFIATFAVIVLLPPVLHGDKLLVINNDTANHLVVFESIKTGNPQFLYLGQEITGNSLVWIEKVTGFGLSILFMWFNFLAVLLGGLAVAVLVIVTTKSWLGGALSSIFIIFGTGSTQHLFWSGTIFNLVEYLILLPLLLINFYFTIEKKRTKFALPALVGVGTLMFFFHPSFGEGIKYLLKPTIYPESTINLVTAFLLFFGIINLVLLVPCWLGIKSKEEKTEIRTKIVFGIVAGLSLSMLLLATFALTPYSSRMIINAFLLLGIVLCIYIGEAMKSKSKLIRSFIIGLITLGALPSLINWFTWTSFYNPIRGAY